MMPGQRVRYDGREAVIRRVLTAPPERDAYGKSRIGATYELGFPDGEVVSVTNPDADVIVPIREPSEAERWPA